jgi:thiamine transporter ThiT
MVGDSCWFKTSGVALPIPLEKYFYSFFDRRGGRFVRTYCIGMFDISCGVRYGHILQTTRVLILKYILSLKYMGLAIYFSSQNIRPNSRATVALNSPHPFVVSSEVVIRANAK